MPEFKYVWTVVVFFIGAIALYCGLTGRDMGARRTIVGDTLPLPKAFSRVLCFVVAGIAIYMLVTGQH